MHSNVKLLLVAPLLALVALSLGCVTTGDKESSKPERRPSNWVKPASGLESEIAKHAESLPWTHGRDRVDLISWFASVGEPAYDTLLLFLEDERPEVVGTALAALGATRDARLVPYLRDAERASWSGPLRLESARTRVRLGDWEAMPVLIDGLESEDHFKRAMCAQALFEATRENKGFAPGAALPEREEAVARWRTWWQQRSSDGLLVKGS